MVIERLNDSAAKFLEMPCSNSNLDIKASMSQDQQRHSSAGVDKEKSPQAQGRPPNPFVEIATRRNPIEKEQVMFVFESSSFPGIEMCFGKDGDLRDGFIMTEDASRFDIPDLASRDNHSIKHAVSFGIELPDGRLELKESLSLFVATSPHSVVIQSISVPSGDYTVLQCCNVDGGDAANQLVVHIALNSDRTFRTSYVSFRHLSDRRTDWMFLRKGTIRDMKNLEVRIPYHQRPNFIVENVFRDLQRAFNKPSPSQSSASTISTPENISAISGFDTTGAALASLTSSRRVQGADFGPHFMTLSVQEKLDAIEDKILTHVRDEQQLLDCRAIIKGFERAVELDEAVGPLGNGNVTSEICRMNKDDVPHEMLDLFLMMGQLRVQRRKEKENKKRKWDLTNF